MTNDLQAIRKQVDSRLNALAASRLQVASEKKAMREASQYQIDLREALAIAQFVAQTIQEEAHAKIATIVSRALATVFEEPIEFKILFEQKRGRTEAVLSFCKNDMNVDPMTACGGGLLDIAGFALRLSTLLLSRPPLRKLLVLDEPFRFLSREYRAKARVLMETLSKELGVQIVMVTHSPELECGKIINL